MMNYNDIVEIDEVISMFNGTPKTVRKTYLVKSININEITIEDMDNPKIRKNTHPSKIATINGMTIKRNAKVGL